MGSILACHRVLNGRIDEIAVGNLELAVDLWEDHRWFTESWGVAKYSASVIICALMKKMGWVKVCTTWWSKTRPGEVPAPLARMRRGRSRRCASFRGGKWWEMVRNGGKRWEIRPTLCFNRGSLDSWSCWGMTFSNPELWFAANLPWVKKDFDWVRCFFFG